MSALVWWLGAIKRSWLSGVHSARQRYRLERDQRWLMRSTERLVKEIQRR